MATKVKPPMEFFTAAATGDLETVQKYLVADYNIDSMKGYGQDRVTGLIEAVNNGHLAVVKELLKSGADPNLSTTVWCCSPLQCAGIHGDIKIAEFLVQSGALVNKTDRSGVTPLIAACHNGHIDVARFLLQNGADLEHRTGFEIVPTLVQKSRETLESDNPLREMFFGPFTQNNALTKAVWTDNIEMAKLLLDQGCNINAQNGKGNTALNVAALTGNVKMVNLLIDTEADMEIKNEKAATPLLTALDAMFATEEEDKVKNYFSILNLLLKAGSDALVKDNFGHNFVQKLFVKKSKNISDIELFETCCKRLILLACELVPQLPLNSLPLQCQDHLVELYDHVTCLTQTPQTLSHLCRFTVRKTMRRYICRKIDTLTREIPEHLKHYLKLHR